MKKLVTLLLCGCMTGCPVAEQVQDRVDQGLDVAEKKFNELDFDSLKSRDPEDAIRYFHDKGIDIEAFKGCVEEARWDDMYQWLDSLEGGWTKETLRAVGDGFVWEHQLGVEGAHLKIQEEIGALDDSPRRSALTVMDKYIMGKGDMTTADVAVRALCVVVVVGLMYGGSGHPPHLGGGELFFPPTKEANEDGKVEPSVEDESN